MACLEEVGKIWDDGYGRVMWMGVLVRLYSLAMG